MYIDLNKWLAVGRTHLTDLHFVSPINDMNKSKSKTVNIIDIDTGISRENLQKIANILNDDLADEYVLLTKTRDYHWNVEDPRFNDLHKFFEEQYELIDAAIDEIAERVMALGAKTRATLKEFINSSQIQEDIGSYPNADTMPTNLLSDHETIINTLSKKHQGMSRVKRRGNIAT